MREGCLFSPSIPVSYHLHPLSAIVGCLFINTMQYNWIFGLVLAESFIHAGPATSNMSR